MPKATLTQIARADIRYRILRLAVIAARFLPEPLARFMSECMGEAFFLFSSGRRRNVSDNLRRVLGPEVEEKELRRKVRSVFKNMARNYFDLARLSRSSFQNFDRTVTIEGWHHLADALENARGTIIATAHLGSFDVAALALAARGIDMTIFVEAIDSGPVVRNIAQLRQKNGCRFVPVGLGAMKDGLQALRRGGTLTIVCDRDIQGNGLKVSFFGEETTLPVGAVSLALRSGATIVPVFSVRKPSNRFAIYIEPPLVPVDVGNRSESIRANLENLTAVLERHIRKYPDQWVVLEPIWPSRTAEPITT